MPRTLRAALLKPVLERDPRHGGAGLWSQLSGASTYADVLAPDGVDRHAASVIEVGDSYLVTLEVATLPPSLALGWLQDELLLLDEPGITVHQCIEPVPDAAARRLLARSETAALGTLAGDMHAGVSADVDAEHGMEAAHGLRRDLAAGTDRLLRIAITITVAAATVEAVAQRVDDLRRAAGQIGVDLRVARYLQWEGYLASLPLSRMPEIVRHDISGKAAAMSVPQAFGGPISHSGRPVVYGEYRKTGEPITWDRWTATNPHSVVIAESGSGKTYAMAGYIAQDVALGEDAVLILDPKNHEYRALTVALGGAYITLSKGAGYHINPLELPKLSAERSALLRDLEEDLLAQRVSFVKDLLLRELRAQGQGIDAVALNFVEHCLFEAYRERGITTDPATFDRPMPILGDVERCMQRLAGTDEQHGRTAQAMRLFTAGVVGALFNAPSNIPLQNPLLTIDLSSLLHGRDEMLERLIPAIVGDFFVSVALHRPTGRRSHLVLDEGHTLLRTPSGAATMNLIYRVGRSLGFAATVITQSLDDLEHSPLTRVLLENARTKLVLGLNGDSGAVDRAARLLQLNAKERAYLATCRLEPHVGASGLLLADGQRTKLWIPRWPPTLHSIASGEHQAIGAERDPSLAAPRRASVAHGAGQNRSLAPPQPTGMAHGAGQNRAAAAHVSRNSAAAPAASHLPSQQVAP